MLLRLVSCVCLLAACGDDDVTGAADAGGDAARDAGAAFAAPVVPPSMAPCPDGWVEETVASGAVHCEPWPSGAPTDCGPDEAAFPGTGGCARVGTDCPAGDFPTDLPSGSVVLHVRAGATGGDGTEARPFGRINDALAASGAGTVVAVGKGRYTEQLPIRSGVTVWGACVRETILSSATPDIRTGVVTTRGRGGALRNLRIEGAPQAAVFVGDGVDLRVEDVVVEDVEFAGLLVFGTGDLDVHNVAVRGTRLWTSARTGGIGLAIIDGSVTVQRASFVRNHSDGAVVDGMGATMALEEVAVRGTRNSGDGTLGTGIGVDNMSTAAARAVVAEGNLNAGVVVQSASPSALEVEHAVVRDNLPRVSDDHNGYGFVAAGGGSVAASKVLAVGNRASGIIVSNTTVRFEDTIVRGTTPDRDGLYGRGIEIQLASAGSEIRRMELDDNTDVGAFVGGALVDVRVEDLTVLRTRSRPSRAGGRGLELLAGATMQLARAYFEGNREFTVAAFQDGTSLTALDFAVTETLTRECVDTGCDPAGMGVGVYLGASVALAAFDIAGSATCGIHVATGAGLDLSDGQISTSPIGACVQVDGYDVMRLSESVFYRDNDINLQATMLPVPEPSTNNTAL